MTWWISSHMSILFSGVRYMFYTIVHVKMSGSQPILGGPGSVAGLERIWLWSQSHPRTLWSNQALGRTVGQGRQVFFFFFPEQKRTNFIVGSCIYSMTGGFKRFVSWAPGTHYNIYLIFIHQHDLISYSTILCNIIQYHIWISHMISYDLWSHAWYIDSFDIV